MQGSITRINMCVSKKRTINKRECKEIISKNLTKSLLMEFERSVIYGDNWERTINLLEKFQTIEKEGEKGITLFKSAH